MEEEGSEEERGGFDVPRHLGRRMEASPDTLLMNDVSGLFQHKEGRVFVGCGLRVLMVFLHGMAAVLIELHGLTLDGLKE